MAAEFPTSLTDGRRSKTRWLSSQALSEAAVSTVPLKKTPNARLRQKRSENIPGLSPNLGVACFMCVGRGEDHKKPYKQKPRSADRTTSCCRLSRFGRVASVVASFLRQVGLHFDRIHRVGLAWRFQRRFAARFTPRNRPPFQVVGCCLHRFWRPLSRSRIRQRPAPRRI